MLGGSVMASSIVMVISITPRATIIVFYSTIPMLSPGGSILGSPWASATKQTEGSGSPTSDESEGEGTRT